MTLKDGWKAYLVKRIKKVSWFLETFNLILFMESLTSQSFYLSKIFLFQSMILKKIYKSWLKGINLIDVKIKNHLVKIRKMMS